MGDRRFLIPVLLGIALAVVIVHSGVGQASWEGGYDLNVYRDGARDLLAGRDLYRRETDRGHWFVYPPFASVLFVPLLLLPASADLVLWDGVLVAVTVWGCWRILRTAGSSGWALGLGVAFVLLSDPFREALVLGQISPLVVLGLVLGCFYGGRRGALLAALSGAVKVTPALVVAALLNPWARRWFALPVVVLGAVLTLVGVLVSPRSAVSYFGGLLWDSDRVAPPWTITNNSLAGAFAHAGFTSWQSEGLSAACAVPLLVLVGFVARRCDWRDRSARVRFGLLVSLVTCLVSPVTWSHHALAAPIAVVVLLVSRRATPLVVLAGIPWLLPVLQWGPVINETRPLSLLVLVVLLVPRRTPQRGAAAASPPDSLSAR